MTTDVSAESLPIIDIGALIEDGDVPSELATALHEACRQVGFFYVTGHGVDPGLVERLDKAARIFFALPDVEKAAVTMDRAGRAWRGWFPLGGELTSGLPDLKEGLYFGAELGPADARVVEGRLLHGANQFPEHPSELGTAVLDYMDALTALGQAILRGLAVGLGLPPSWFAVHLTDDPLILFRVFRYPPLTPYREWSVGEHTDYGLLTILGQDDQQGLEVKTTDGWIAVPPIPGTFVCNLGDMLERVTGGLYLSTAHRVRNRSAIDRLSFPFFLDPSWEARVERLPIVERPTEGSAANRWDQLSVHGFTGTYGDYVSAKVSRVFPELAGQA